MDESKLIKFKKWIAVPALTILLRFTVIINTSYTWVEFRVDTYLSRTLEAFKKIK